MIVAKFSTLAGGVFIEQTPASEYLATDRCFRFDKSGNAEYAFYGELVKNGDRARFYGHVYTAKDFLLA